MEQAALLQQIRTQLTTAAEELITAAQPRHGQIFVVGCSTSEVLGEKIGTAGSPETAQVMMDASSINRKSGAISNASTASTIAFLLA